MRLQPQIIYPDVEPSFHEPPDDYETNFKRLPVVCELLMQQMAGNKLTKPNPFAALMPGDFEGRPYDSEDIDREIYVFKSEWDRILFSESKVAFVTPQLKDILASEIDYIKQNNFPLLDSTRRAVDQEELFRAARAMLRIYQGRGFRGLGQTPAGMTTDDLRAAADAAASTAPKNLPGGALPANDSFISVMQQLSPFFDVAFKVLAELLTAVISVASQVANGVALGAAIATSTMTALQAIETFGVSWASMQVATMTVQALVQFVIQIMKCVAKWSMMKDQLRALVRAAGQIRDAFNEITTKIVEATKTSMDETDTAMANFRLVMSEMVARIQRGEHILGFLNCNADGSLWISFGVDPRYFRDTGTQTTAPAPIPGAMTPAQKGILAAAGAAILLVAAGGRR
jgi:hypothetical protein